MAAKFWPMARRAIADHARGFAILWLASWVVMMFIAMVTGVEPSPLTTLGVLGGASVLAILLGRLQSSW